MSETYYSTRCRGCGTHKAPQGVILQSRSEPDSHQGRAVGNRGNKGTKSPFGDSSDIRLAGFRPGPVPPEESIVYYEDHENGGYYWFLYPLLAELAEKTRQMIELYGDAAFRCGDLLLVRQTLLETRRLVKHQRERWSVYVDTEDMPNAMLPPPPSKVYVYREVARSMFLSLLDSLPAMADRES